MAKLTINEASDPAAWEREAWRLLQRDNLELGTVALLGAINAHLRQLVSLGESAASRLESLDNFAEFARSTDL